MTTVAKDSVNIVEGENALVRTPGKRIDVPLLIGAAKECMSKDNMPLFVLDDISCTAKSIVLFRELK